MTATTQAPARCRLRTCHLDRAGSTARTDGDSCPVQTRSERSALVRPGRLRASDRARGQLEAHADRPPRAAVRRRARRRRRRDRGRRSSRPRRVEQDDRVASARRRAVRSSCPKTCRARSPGRSEARAPLIRIPQDVELDRADRRSACTARAALAHAHVVIEALPNSRGDRRCSRTRAPPQHAQNVEIIVARRRAPHRRSRCSSGTTTPCTRHPTRPASSATRRSATSS